MRRTGLALSGLVSLFLLIDGGARLAGFAPYVEGLTKFGYSPTLAPWIGPFPLYAPKPISPSLEGS